MSRQKRRTEKQRRPERPSTPALPEPATAVCIIILLLLVAVFFRDILLGNRWFFDDFLYQNYPFRSFAAVSLAMGEFPFWNPYTFNGMPFQADIQTAVFYVPMTLLTLVVTGGKLHHYWLELVIILHFALAAVSTFFLARSFDLRRIPSLLAGVAYGLSGYMVLHAIHQQLLTLVAWYPLVWLLFRRTLESPRWWRVGLTAAVLGHTTFAGFPQLSLYLYAFLGIYLLYALAVRFRGKALFSRPSLGMLARGAATLAISLPVAAVQLLPTLELSALSQRASISYEMAVEGSLDWIQLFTLFNPALFGTPGAGALRYWGPGPYWHFWETCIYVGMLVLLLTALSVFLMRRNSVIPFLWALIGVTLFFALGKNFFFHRLVTDLIPALARFRIPARAAVLTTLAASLLAAFSFHHLLYDSRFPMKRARNLVFGIVAAAALVWLLTVSGSLNAMVPALADPQVFSEVSRGAGVALLMAALAGAAVLLLTIDRWRTPLVAYASVALVFLDISLFAGSHNNGTVNPAEYFGRTRRLTDVIRKEQQTELFRVNTRSQAGMIMDRNQGMVDRIFTMEGFTPLVLQHYLPPTHTVEQLLDLMNAKYRTVTDSVRRTLSLDIHPTYFPRAFFLYNPLVIEQEDGQERYMRSAAFDHRTTAVLGRPLHAPIAPPDTTPAWSARFSRFGINGMSLDVETASDGLLVLSEIWYPGWIARVDGAETPMYRTDVSLRGIVVPAGRHAVDVLFAPEPVRQGAAATGGALALCTTLVLVSVFKSRRRGSPTPPDETPL